MAEVVFVALAKVFSTLTLSLLGGKTFINIVEILKGVKFFYENKLFGEAFINLLVSVLGFGIIGFYAYLIISMWWC